MILAMLHDKPGFATELGALRADWKQDCIVHSDLRWSNCLILESPETKLKLIDWELVDCGERAWDIGGVLQCWLGSWINSMPDTDGPPNELVRSASWPLSEMKPAISAFWNAYVRATRMNRAAARSLLQRSTKYAAARLLQSTLEAMHERPVLTSRGVCGIQLGLNILNDPARATTDLLGLGS
jgi:thiamine kinase-like enzyme